MDIEKMFPKFYRENKMRISNLLEEAAGRTFQKDPTMKIVKTTDIFKSKKEQIEIIEKRSLLWKSTRKNKKKHIPRIDYDDDSDIQSNKRYKAK
jgi:hypothetical protein